MKRVLIAKARCTGPMLVFLDEPTRAYDVELRRDCGSTFASCSAGGTTVVLTTTLHRRGEEARPNSVGIIDKRTS